MKTMKKRPYEQPEYELIEMLPSVFAALVSGLEVGKEDQDGEEDELQ